MAPFAVRFATALALCSSACRFRYSCSATTEQSSDPFPRQPNQHQQPTAPAVLRFTSPTNGSTVDGPNVPLAYTLNAARGDGRELTTSEIQDLTVSVNMCFELQGFDKTETCAGLRVTSVTIKEALPAKWHTVTATVRSPSKAEGWKNAGDAVSVFVGLEGYPNLAKDMCGDSACLDSTDVRSAYFDHIYRLVLGAHVCGALLYGRGIDRSGLR